MIHFLLNTDHFTLYDHKNAKVCQNIGAHASGSIAVSAVTVEEALRGRLAALTRRQSGQSRIRGYQLLTDSLQLLQRFPILAFDAASEQRFQQLWRLRPRVGSQDPRIASIALENGVTLVTGNTRDFSQVPGLTLEDWSV